MRSDIDFLGLTEAGGPGRFTFTVRNHLARLDGRLYGGTAIAVSMAAAEVLTRRQSVWMTTQFVATAPPEERVSVHAEVLAAGRRANQVRVTGTDADGAVMFASLGTTGVRSPDGMEGTFERMPQVSPPDASRPISNLFECVVRDAGVESMPDLPEGVGFLSVTDSREPDVGDHPDPGPGRLCVWMRRSDRAPLTPAMVAYMADLVPLSVAHACGVVGGGISLDNSIRVGSFAETEWTLLDLRPHMVSGDYGHGAVHAWSENGELLATAGQSASMMHFDLADGPWTDPGRG